TCAAQSWELTTVKWGTVDGASNLVATRKQAMTVAAMAMKGTGPEVPGRSCRDLERLRTGMGASSCAVCSGQTVARSRVWEIASVRRGAATPEGGGAEARRNHKAGGPRSETYLAWRRASRA